MTLVTFNANQSYMQLTSCISFIVLLLASLSSCNTHYYTGAQSDHFDGTRFYYQTNKTPVKNAFSILKWRFTRENISAPDNVPIQFSQANLPERIANRVSVTYIYHASFVIQTQNINIITDPIYSQRASPVSFAGPKRLIPPAVAFEHLPPIDYILISHNHYDHLDIPTIKRLNQKFSPKLIAGLGICNYLNHSQDINIKCIALDWQQELLDNSGVKFTFLPAKHWSARGLFDRNTTLWGAFAISTNAGHIYFAGDSAYSPHFKQAGQQFGSFMLSLIPIGAYAPRWFMQESHVNPQEAVQAHLDLNSQLSIGMHYGSFDVSDEAYQQPLIDLELAKRKYKVDNFITLEFGQDMQL
jgi:L-ascorbate metabolism protein UlaG (beta-lactamase superfamily)